VRRVSVAVVGLSRARGLPRIVGGQRRVREAIRLVQEGGRAGPVLPERSAPTASGPGGAGGGDGRGERRARGAGTDAGAGVWAPTAAPGCHGGRAVPSTH